MFSHIQRKIFGFLMGAVIVFTTGIAIAVTTSSFESTLKPIPQPENKFHEVVDVFLAAVDRGELVVFDNRITRGMLDPVQVKYVYTFDDAKPTISVYSLLTTNLKIPGADDCSGGGIEVLLDIDGTIIDSSVHIPSN